MKIVLVSFFDTNNLGDLLIGKMLYDKVNMYASDIVKISYLNGTVFEEFNLKISSYIENEKKIKNNKINNLYDKIMENTPLYRLRSNLYVYEKKYDYSQFEKAIKDADVLVIGGGNMIFDLNKRSLAASRFLYYVKTAKKYNKKIFSMSLGIGPFQTKYQKNLAAKSLAMCDFISFRDKKSKELYDNNKYSSTKSNLAADPVFLLPQMLDGESKKSYIGINIINNPDYRNKAKQNETIIEGYVKLIESVVSDTGNKVILFSTETRDYEVIDEVYMRIEEMIKNEVEIIYVNSFNDLIDLYSKLKFIIGTRMHAMIIAYTQFIPIIGLSWQPKVREMFKIINQENNLFELLNLKEETNNIVKIITKKSEYDSYELDVSKQIALIKENESINDVILEKILNNNL